ncbi:MAG: hypothetical protein KDA41_18410, partial [Planctomycetales bacterium]|nr:hypothetical protein [Planctomycetales bacterium]
DFLPRLARCFGRRILLKNFLFDFSMESVFLTIGAPMLLSGLVFGLTRWRHYAQLNQPSPTGTVVISALLVILGFQLLLSAVSEDLRSVPTTPWCNGPLLPRRRTAGEPSSTGARRAINLPPR